MKCILTYVNGSRTVVRVPAEFHDELSESTSVILGETTFVYSGTAAGALLFREADSPMTLNPEWRVDE